MVVSNKKFSVKIPPQITYIYCKSKNILILTGLNGVIKWCKLQFKLVIDTRSNKLFITDQFTKVQFKKVKSHRGLELSVLKQLIKELSMTNYKRVNLIGVGYRAIVLSNKAILNLKLGFSHQIYIKIPSNMTVTCPKPNVIFVLGTSLKEINEMIALIRTFRVPELYKGKGVLYEYETLKLKEGKSSKT